VRNRNGPISVGALPVERFCRCWGVVLPELPDIGIAHSALTPPIGSFGREGDRCLRWSHPRRLAPGSGCHATIILGAVPTTSGGRERPVAGGPGGQSVDPRWALGEEGLTMEVGNPGQQRRKCRYWRPPGPGHGGFVGSPPRGFRRNFRSRADRTPKQGVIGRSEIEIWVSRGPPRNKMPCGTHGARTLALSVSPKVRRNLTVQLLLDAVSLRR
jgi:hypothetical protein